MADDRPSTDARRMSDVEAMMWNLEKDPFLSATFGSISILDRPLDFKTLQAGGASDTSAWGPQFREDGEADALSPADLGGGHLVLARKSVNASELRP